MRSCEDIVRSLTDALPAMAFVLEASADGTHTVPAEAPVRADVRVSSPTERDRIDAAIRRRAPKASGTPVEVLAGWERPPLEPLASADLVALAEAGPPGRVRDGDPLQQAGARARNNARVTTRAGVGRHGAR